MEQNSKKYVEEDGIIRWRLPNGKRHRLNGPAIEWADGHKDWWVNGKRHRLDGPAVECGNGHKEWFVNGKRHRLDGPAVERADGSKEWWVNGEIYLFKNYCAKVKPLISEEAYFTMLLTYGDKYSA